MSSIGNVCAIAVAGLLLSACASSPRGTSAQSCNGKSWMSSAITEDVAYRYYVGHGSDEDAALTDAQEQAVRENFGTIAQVRRESRSSNTDETSAKKTEEVSGRVRLQDFVRLQTCSDRWDDDKKITYVQYRYSKIAIGAEKDRLKSIEDEEKPAAIGKLIPDEEPARREPTSIDPGRTTVTLSVGGSSGIFKQLPLARALTGVDFHFSSPLWDSSIGVYGAFSGADIPSSSGSLFMTNVEIPLGAAFKVSPYFKVGPEVVLDPTWISLSYKGGQGATVSKFQIGGGARAGVDIGGFGLLCFARSYFAAGGAISFGATLGFDMGAPWAQ